MFKKLDREVREWREHHKTPGIVIAVTNADELLHIAADGVEELSTREPVNADTLFEIGSVTKSFTGIAVAQLADRGMLDLDASILDIMPWARFESPHPPFTVRHMVTHTAGLPSGRADLPTTRFRARDIGPLYGTATPGTYFYYTDFGFHLLSHVIEVVSGQPYAEYVRDNIFAPLGMDDSEPAMVNAIRPRLACAYEGIFDDRPFIRAHELLAGPWFEHAEGDGCIASTAIDMGAYLRMLLNHGTGPDGEALLSPAAFQQFASPFIRKDEKTHYGFGIEIRQAAGYTALEHEGVIAGYRAYLGIDQAAGVGVMVMQNGPGDATTIGRYALELARAKVTGAEAPEDPKPEMFHPAPYDIQYEGSYYDDDGTELRVGRIDGKLTIEVVEAVIELEQTIENLYYADHPTRMAVYPLHFHCKGKRVEKITHAATTYVRDGNAPLRKPLSAEFASMIGHYRAMSTLLSNFRVIARGDDLVMVTPDGGEEQLSRIEGATYRVGTDTRIPEYLSFDEAVDGKVLRVSLGGTAYYRTFTQIGLEDDAEGDEDSVPENEQDGRRHVGALRE